MKKRTEIKNERARVNSNDQTVDILVDKNKGRRRRKNVDKKYVDKKTETEEEDALTLDRK